ncbi:unnamed protein product [Caenorhabditis auriculariae]|uniref:G-protein coupled receptors family 1 profile domain-containing protein n=1 Tax=Caenorhabditis auriculariae TaxID=2777116 RepID=A0A8S1HFW0_9PELO|nr:unnamed protein product [Caenorhabditis auriculariae]
MVVNIAEAILSLNAAFGTFFNVLLLIVAWFTPLPSNSKYKNLVMLFAAFNVIYSLINVTMKPILYVKSHSLYLITFVSENESSFKRFEVMTYMVIVLESHYLLLVNFLYRYFMISRKVAETKNAFRRSDVVVLISLNFVLVTVLTFFIKYFEAKDFIDPQVQKEIEDVFHVKIPRRGFFFAELSKDNLESLFMISCLLGDLLVIIVLTMIVGYKTYKLLNQHVLNLPIQKQIFRAILCQCIAPFFLGFLPSHVIVVCTVLDINLGAYNTLLHVFLSFQPVVDPFFTLFLIKIYRDKVVGFLTFLCKKEHPVGISSVGIASAQVTPEQIIYVKGYKLAFVTTFLTHHKWRFFEIVAYMIIVMESHYLLFVNFLYRYFSVSRKVAETKNAFSRTDIVLLVISNAALVSMFTLLAKYFEADVSRDPTMYAEIQEVFHVEIPRHGFFYAELSKDNTQGFCMLTGLLGLFFIIPLAMMVVGFKTYKLLNQHILNLPIQKQIFHAIIGQSLAPFFLGFLPSLIAIACTFEGINLGIYTNVLFVFHSLQPVADPLFTLLLIKIYREKVIETFFCRKKQPVKFNSVGSASAQVAPEQIEITSLA